MKLSVVFGWVKNSDNFDFFMITSVVCLSFPRMWRVCKGFQSACFYVFQWPGLQPLMKRENLSLFKKTCWLLFPLKAKFV